MIVDGLGGSGFAPNPVDGLTFLFEPLRPLASTIVDDAESLNAPAVQASVYAFALLLLVLEPHAVDRRRGLAKQPLKKYGVRV